MPSQSTQNPGVSRFALPRRRGWRPLLVLAALGVGVLCCVEDTSACGRRGGRRGGCSSPCEVWAPAFCPDFPSNYLSSSQSGRGKPKVHALLLLSDESKLFGRTTDIDSILMARLLEQQIPAEQLDNTSLLQTRGGLTRGRVLEAVSKLNVAPGDAVVCFYSGPVGAVGGGEGKDRGGDLLMPDGDALGRKELLDALAVKKGKLTVLMTDALGEQVGPGDEELLVNVPSKAKVLPQLLFGYRGVVDVNSCAAGESGYCQIGHYTRGEKVMPESLGSVFMWELYKEGTLGASTAEKELAWQDFLGRVQENTRQSVADLTAPGGKPAVQRPTALQLNVQRAPPTEDASDAGAAPVTVVVRVPAATRVYFDDEPTRQGGAERTFTSPPLAADRSFCYILRAEFDREGATYAETRAVHVRGGQIVEVDFGDLRRAVRVTEAAVTAAP